MTLTMTVRTDGRVSFLLGILHLIIGVGEKNEPELNPRINVPWFLLFIYTDNSSFSCWKLLFLDYPQKCSSIPI